MHIRLATPGDVPVISQLIRDLATFERSPEQAVATDEQLRRALFGENPHVFCYVAELDHEIVGFALWFLNYSTWTGTSGVYLEDLFVRASSRGRGVATALLRQLAQLCVERGYARLSWWVLDWNERAISFYRSLGAEAMDEWTVYRVSGDALRALAAG